MNTSQSYTKYIRLALKWAGLDDGIHKNARWRKIYFLWFLIIVTLNGITALQYFLEAYFYKDAEVTEFCLDIIYGVSGLISMAQSLYIYLNREKVKLLLDKTDRVFKYRSETDIDQVDMEGYLDKCRKIVIIWTSMYLVATHLLILWSIIISPEERTLSVTEWHSYEWKMSAYYETSLACICLGQYSLTVIFITVDIQVSCLSIITNGQLKIIGTNYKNCLYTALLKYGVSKNDVGAFRKSLYGKDEWKENLANQINGGTVYHITGTKKFRAILYQTFVARIIDHQRMLSFCKDMEDYLSPLMFFRVYLNVFHASMLTFCLVTEKDTSFLITIASCEVISIFQLFTYSLCGQLVENASAELLNRLLKCPWYLCDTRFRKSFLFAQMRCARYTKLTAGKIADLNFELFVKFLNLVISYTTVLRGLTDKAQY